MFPMVPYHQLPALHEKIKHDTPAADISIAHACMSVFPVLWEQRENNELFLRRKLPISAAPYNVKFKG